MKIGTALSMSLDGFIAGIDDSSEQPLGVGGERLFNWLRDGDTPSRIYPSIMMSAISAQFFDEGVSRLGAIIAGRRTYDVSEAWGGSGPSPGIPLFVLTHHVPATVPTGDPPYTFVVDGIESAVEKAKAAAAGKNVHLMGANVVQQCIGLACLTSSPSTSCRSCSDTACVSWMSAIPASSWSPSELSTPQVSRI